MEWVRVKDALPDITYIWCNAQERYMSSYEMTQSEIEKLIRESVERLIERKHRLERLKKVIEEEEDFLRVMQDKLKWQEIYFKQYEKK